MEQKNSPASSYRLLAGYTLLLSLAMVGIFRLCNALTAAVWYGTALGTAGTLLTLLLLQITIVKVNGCSSSEQAQTLLRASTRLRLLITIVVIYLGFMLPFFQPVAVVLPFLFPRVAAIFVELVPTPSAAVGKIKEFLQRIGL